MFEGKLVGLPAKLSPDPNERRGQFFVPADAWSTIELPQSVASSGHLAVLICLDFLYRDNDRFSSHVDEQLENTRLYAVPSFTRTHTLPEFMARANEEARRYKRPVLYANSAQHGGTTILVDDDPGRAARSFPDGVGQLGIGEEGVLVADVELGERRPGRSRSYADDRTVIPVAAASLVYRTTPKLVAYADWLDHISKEGSPTE